MYAGYPSPVSAKARTFEGAKGLSPSSPTASATCRKVPLPTHTNVCSACHLPAGNSIAEFPGTPILIETTLFRDMRGHSHYQEGPAIMLSTLSTVDGSM
jgi:hypothetical protein